MPDPLPKVLMVTTTVSRRGGGLFLTVRRLAQCMAEQGVPVQVFGYRDDRTEEDLPAWYPVEPTLFSRSALPFPGYYRGLGRALRAAAGGPAVLHVHGLWLAKSWTCRRAADALGMPRIVSPRGMLDPWALRRSGWKKRLAGMLYEFRCLRTASCIHVLHEAEAAQVRGLGLRNRLAVIPNGVDLPELHPLPPGRDPAPEKWRGKRVMLFLSRVDRKKGLVPLIHAWARVAPAHPEWVLAVAGPDERGHAAETARLVARHGLEDAVRYVGPRYGGEKDRWLRRADAFVLPSFSEGFPMALLEALAYGLPAVITRACNFSEAAAAGAALEAEPRPPDLARALRTFFALPEDRRRAMGEAGRRLVAERYGWPAAAERMLEVYRWLLEGGPSPSCVAPPP